MRPRTIAALTLFAGAAGWVIYAGWGPIVSGAMEFGVLDMFLGLTREGWLYWALPPALVLCAADLSLRQMKRANSLALKNLAHARLSTSAPSSVPVGMLQEPAAALEIIRPQLQDALDSKL